MRQHTSHNEDLHTSTREYVSLQPLTMHIKLSHRHRELIHSPPPRSKGAVPVHYAPYFRL